MDPAAEFPAPSDDRQALQTGVAASAPTGQDGSERKVTLSLTLAMRQSGPARLSRRRRRQAEVPARIAIGEVILRWLHWPAQPSVTAAPPPHPEAPRPAAVSFWEALDPAERQALAAVAVPQKFPADAALMREGDQADHVMVIMQGRAEVSVDENGWERTLAERGPGELVGERGGLQVRIRSASVIALEAVRVLTVRTSDFQSFVNAHPKVFNIVEQQLYDRLTETPGRHAAAEGATPLVLPLNGENCTILYSDVVGFSSLDRNDADRLVIRKALLHMTRLTLQKVPGAWSQDRGDGLLTVVPPSVPTAEVIAHLHRELPSALERHNRTHQESTRFRLRIAVDVGPVTSDTIGVSGEAIIVAVRMLDAPIFKTAIGASTANLGVIASRFVYDTAIRHSLNPLDLAGYYQVLVEVKELTIPAWIKLFNAPVSPVYFHRSAAPDSFGTALVAFVVTVGGDPQQRLYPGQGLPEVGLGGQVVGLGQGQPAERGVRALRAHRPGSLGGHEEPDVRMFVRGFALAGRDVHDDHVPDLGVGPRRQIGQAGLLLRFTGDDGERVGLPRVAMAAHLKPGLLALMPAQQHPPGGRVHDQRGRGDVQREVSPVRIRRSLSQRSDPLQVGRFCVALRAVPVQERGQVRHRTSMAAARARLPGNSQGFLILRNPANRNTCNSDLQNPLQANGLAEIPDDSFTFDIGFSGRYRGRRWHRVLADQVSRAGRSLASPGHRSRPSGIRRPRRPAGRPGAVDRQAAARYETPG